MGGSRRKVGHEPQLQQLQERSCSSSRFRLGRNLRPCLAGLLSHSAWVSDQHHLRVSGRLDMTDQTSGTAPPDRSDEYRARDLFAEGEWPSSPDLRFGGVIFNGKGEVLYRRGRLAGQIAQGLERAHPLRRPRPVERLCGGLFGRLAQSDPGRRSLPSHQPGQSLPRRGAPPSPERTNRTSRSARRPALSGPAHPALGRRQARMDGHGVSIGVSKHERPAKWTIEGLGDDSNPA